MLSWPASLGSQQHQLCRHHDLQLIQNQVAPSHGPPARVLSRLSFPARSLLLPKPHGKREHPKAAWSQKIPHGCHLGLNPSTSLPLQPHFWLLPQRVIPASIPVFFQVYWAAIVRQAWPHSMEPIISKLSCRCCNHGELPPSYIMGWSHSHLPGSKHGHGYLTYPWNQLKVIDMLNDHARN